MRAKLLKRYEKIRDNEGNGGPHFYKISIRNNGYLFVKLALDAYYQENITSSDLSNYLGIKLKHLPNIEQTLNDRLKDTIKQ